MNLTAEDLARGFGDSGLESGDVVLVHSSLSSLGWVEGGADAVIDALLYVVGPRGTVVFPTLTGSPQDSADNPPIFHAASTICWTGTIPETARKREDFMRSLHPTHSVIASGEMARWITSGHELVRTPCGYGSPYDKLADVGGKILIIGATQSVNTSFHMAEEMAGVPYVLQNEPINVQIHDREDGEIHMQGIYLHRWGAERDYDSLEGAMIDIGICRIGHTGEAEVRLMDANFQRMFLVRRLIEDPLATLALSERSKWL